MLNIITVNESIILMLLGSMNYSLQQRLVKYFIIPFVINVISVNQLITAILLVILSSKDELSIFYFICK